jgi:hypothetical protein
MIRKSRLVGAIAFGAGLTAAGLAQAQAQTGSAGPAVAAAQPAPPAQPSPMAQVSPPAQATTPWAQPGALTIKPWNPDSNRPTYSVDAPPDGPSGIYLPAAVLGYAKSAAGCVVIGCEDGPQAGGDTASASSAPAAPPPINPGPSGPH